MIVVSKNQKLTFDELQRLTALGRTPWTGALRVPGVPGNTARAAVARLERLGAIEVTSAGKFNTYRVLRNDVRMGSESEVNRARFAGREITREDRPIVDNGEFTKAFPHLAFEDAEVGRDIPFKGQFKPDARVL